jgi:hypothetical protein
MVWLFVIPAIWYWWLLYSLSFNPAQFPDQGYAHRKWDRRSNIAIFLGTTIVDAIVYFTLTQTWWLLLIIVVVSLMVMGLLQPLVVALIIGNRARAVMSRMKRDLPPRKPFLAPFAWTYYLTKKEKMNAVAERRARESAEENKDVRR